MSSALAPAVDALVVLCGTAVTGLTVSGESFAVYDGIDLGEATQENTVVIGGTDTNVSLASLRTFVTFGGDGSGKIRPGHRQEEFTVLCYIRCSTGDLSGQAAMRRGACSAFDAIETALLNDPTLGGVVHGFAVQVSSQTLTQTPPGENVARRWARIDFEVQVRNRY